METIEVSYKKEDILKILSHLQRFFDKKFKHFVPSQKNYPLKNEISGMLQKIDDMNFENHF